MEDHERIEELLAGYVLRSLSGPDAETADRLLTEHVPACPRCRDTLAGFQGVSGELGLAAPPAEPPELLFPRILRDLDEEPSVGRRRRLPLVATAALVAAVVAMGGWNLSVGQRADRASEQASLMQRALETASTSDARLVSLDEDLTEISSPSRRRIYLVGRGVPPPRPGHVYALWLVQAGRAELMAEFVPADGTVVLELTIDPSAYEELWITEEPPGATTPSGPRRWSASL